MAIETVLGWIGSHEAASLDRLCAWLRIPSISTDPAHAPDIARAASFAEAELRALGFAARQVPTPGHPVVLAHHPGPAGGSHPPVLFYGHYDVQPADPEALWESPPFEPRIEAGPHGPRVVARGAVDDKGQVMTFLTALRAWHEAGGGIPVPVTVVLEGEEEIGSPHLEPFLTAHAAELGAGFALISDTNMWDRETPALTTRLRGLCTCEITLHGPARDLHSGLFGGAALNPITALARLLGALHDDTGRVQIPGFYDRVEPPSAEERAGWAALGFDEARFLGAVGLGAPAGEAGVPALERLWARPTAEINGIWGGYAGPGSKTIIPAEASAKLSFRLVPAQDPEAVFDGFRRFVEERLPAAARAEIRLHGLSPGIAVRAGTPAMAAARAALGRVFGRPPVLIGSGGSIPVVEQIRRVLGLDTLLMGFGLDDDRIHSPNEKFDLACFHAGTRAHALLLGELARR